MQRDSFLRKGFSKRAALGLNAVCPVGQRPHSSGEPAPTSTYRAAGGFPVAAACASTRMPAMRPGSSAKRI